MIISVGLFLLFLLVLTIFWPHIIRGVRISLNAGKWGPTIDHKTYFENRVIRAGNPAPWPECFGNRRLSESAIGKLEKLDTTAFLIIQDGALIYEKYWSPFDRKKCTNSFSVAKSIVGTLAGIAIYEGQLSLSSKVGEYLPSFNTPDKSLITVEHLLRMCSGLQWRETEWGAWSHNAEAYYGDDLDKLIDSLEVRRPPGEVFRYASGNTQILARVISKAVGMNISEYTSLKLWTPLGAESDAYWNLDHPDGVEKAFCCFYATPRDFARIGQLFLNDGTWNDKRLLGSDFIHCALKPTYLPDILLHRGNDNYGMHWWIARYLDLEFFYARGIQGQYIICNRDYNMVIVRLGHKRNPVESHTGHPPDLFDHINAALEIVIPRTATSSGTGESKAVP